MENWLQALANLGGLGALAAALFYLHRDTISRFVTELAAEREANRLQLESERRYNSEVWGRWIDMKMRQHEQVVGALVAQDKVLTRLEQMLQAAHGPQPPRST